MGNGKLWFPREAVYRGRDQAFAPSDWRSEPLTQSMLLTGRDTCRYVRLQRHDDWNTRCREAPSARPGANAIVLYKTPWQQTLRSYKEPVLYRMTMRLPADAQGQQQDALAQHAKLATLGALLAGVAHELNNPLSVALLRAESLHEALREGPLAEQTDAIMQAVEHCVHLVHNLLSLARQDPPERCLVQLNTVIEKALQLCVYTLEADDIRVDLQLAPDLPSFLGDPHQLQQVVLNLVTNAYQALREAPAPRRLTLTTRIHPARRSVSLEVADTGPGIPPAVQARIFEPFFTTKPAGHGMGLALCQEIIDNHDGTIRIQSQPGHGTVFHLELPVKVEAEGGLPAPRSEPSRLVAERTATILVIDDEPAVLRALTSLLRRRGYEVDTSANGRLALKQLQRRAYDLILCDLHMPECDGPTLYHELQQRQPQLCQRIIFLTGDVLSLEAEVFLNQVGTPCLSKPCRAAQVQQMVQQVLQAFESQQQPAERPCEQRV